MKPNPTPIRKEGRILDDKNLYQFILTEEEQQLIKEVEAEFSAEELQEALASQPVFEWDPEVLAIGAKDQKSDGPYTISANGFTYTHIEDTETFYLYDPALPLTALKVMKAVLPDVVRSKYQKIIPPDKFYNFGDSTRFKIIKAIQLHHDEPQTSESTEQFIKFFDVLSENIQDHWTVQQQYSAAKWACRQDKSKASSLLLHYGWSPRYKERMRGTSMHKLTITEDGILIDQSYTHTFQERMDAACSEAVLTYEDLKRREAPIEMETVRTAALRTFYYFKEKYISLNNEYGMGIKSKIQSFIDVLLNPLDKTPPIIPQIEEPDDLLEDELILLKWEDFLFDDTYSCTAAAYAQRYDNNKRTAYAAFRQKMKYFPTGVPIQKKDFPVNVEGKQLTAWTRFGFLTNVKRGTYIILDEGDEQ